MPYMTQNESKRQHHVDGHYSIFIYGCIHIYVCIFAIIRTPVWIYPRLLDLWILFDCINLWELLQLQRFCEFFWEEILSFRHRQEVLNVAISTSKFIYLKREQFYTSLGFCLLSPKKRRCFLLEKHRFHANATLVCHRETFVMSCDANFT